MFSVLLFRLRGGDEAGEVGCGGECEGEGRQDAGHREHAGALARLLLLLACGLKTGRLKTVKSLKSQDFKSESRLKDSGPARRRWERMLRKKMKKITAEPPTAHNCTTSQNFFGKLILQTFSIQENFDKKPKFKEGTSHKEKRGTAKFYK